MAAKRIAQSSINWSELAERVPASQKINFLAFKGRSDKYLRAVAANPAQSPKIDWSHYKGRVATAGIVDSFQKAYDSLKIPYPQDKLSTEVDSLRTQSQQNIVQFKQKSDARIAENEAEIAKLKAMLPYSQMTMEDFYDAHPDIALNPLKNPTLWPHDEESQPGYVDPKAEEHH